MGRMKKIILPYQQGYELSFRKAKTLKHCSTTWYFLSCAAVFS